MEIWRFNIRHLQAFLKTVELGTLIGAAKEVNLSQPAISQAIAKLEAQLDCSLFERRNEGMNPTVAANVIYPRIKETLRYIGRTNITRTQIKAFLSFAQRGSFIEASKTTGLSVVSLHRAVRDLEISLKQPLTRRLGRGLVLTDYGHAQARLFGLASAELRYMVEDLVSCQGVRSGSITIGAMPVCRARVLPAAIVAFQTAFPEINIKISEGSYAELIEPLLIGELDFLIGALREPTPGADLIQSPLFTDDPVVVARAEHPIFSLSQSSESTVGLLSSYPWCVPQSGAPLRDRWERWFRGENLSLPNISVVCGSIIVNRQILLKTDSLTILSSDQVAVELNAGLLKVVCSLPKELNRTIGLLCRKDWRPTDSQACFIDILKNISQSN